MCIGARAGSPAMSRTSRPIARRPICWIGWLIVVSGGLGQRGLGHVVEADDRQVVGDAQAAGRRRPPWSRSPSSRSRRRSRSGGRAASSSSRAGVGARLGRRSRRRGPGRGVDRDAGAAPSPARKPSSRSRADSRSGRPPSEPDPPVAEARAGARWRAGRRAGCRSRPSACPSGRCAGRRRRPGRRAAVDDRGVTRMAPSMSVPASRDRERRSQPTCSRPRPPAE